MKDLCNNGKILKLKFIILHLKKKFFFKLRPESTYFPDAARPAKTYFLATATQKFYTTLGHKQRMTQIAIYHHLYNSYHFWSSPWFSSSGFYFKWQISYEIEFMSADNRFYLGFYKVWGRDMTSEVTGPFF